MSAFVDDASAERVVRRRARVQRSRPWVFTLNTGQRSDTPLSQLQDDNMRSFLLAKEDELKRILLARQQGGDVRYAVFQLEQGDEGMFHFQGYVVLAQAQRFSYIRNLFNPLRPHIEARHGTHDEARDYCMKEETRQRPPIEMGRSIDDWVYAWSEHPTPPEVDFVWYIYQGRDDDVSDTIVLSSDSSDATLSE